MSEHRASLLRFGPLLCIITLHSVSQGLVASVNLAFVVKILFLNLKLLVNKDAYSLQLSRREVGGALV